MLADHPPARSSRQALLDIAAVADRLGVTVRHVRRLVAERRIPFVRWGRRLRFDPAEIDAWLDRHRYPEDGAAWPPGSLT